MLTSVNDVLHDPISISGYIPLPFLLEKKAVENENSLLTVKGKGKAVDNREGSSTFIEKRKVINNEKGGVLGEIKNYYVVMEYQDRRTPHCHMLIWFQGAPDPIELRNCLKFDDFREQLMLYINDIVKEDISYLFRMCTKSCKKYCYGRASSCRFDFPRELVEAPGKIYPELGIIALQRCNAYINNYNPYITTSCRGNNDIRFIATAKLALAYIHYITDYITKSDMNTHNSFLMCAMTLNKFVTEVLSSDELPNDFMLRSRKLVTICLNKIVGQMEMTGPQVSAYLLENSDTSSNEDKLDLENSSEYNQTNDEMFMVINFGKRIDAVNLRIDYMYHGEQLENIIIHPQHSTHIQIHWSRENDKIPVLCRKGVPPRNDLKNIERYGLCILLLFKPWTTANDLIGKYNSWHETCNTFLQNPNLLMRLRSIINNIELLHQCAEEIVLDRHLRQVARENLEIAKIQQIERSVMEYDDIGDVEIPIDQYDFDVDNSISLNPYEIMHTGLRDAKFVDDAMLHLYLKDKFNNKNIVQSNSQEETDVSNNDKQKNYIRPSCENDNHLVKTWQKIIASRKGIEQTDNNTDSEKNYVLQSMFRKFSSDLNNE
ncbi:hypothetical protein Glove_232g142 [Diversispora epigaea]|uniref:Helitron helicase-like domain-containing protein n=1 Tax=Diversispora epigaea TaxID=1348612 RepID=A0A397IHD4_9GLOM|nr:hypothetical protein Glove_232g142 [Diversispora epigaea]